MIIPSRRASLSSTAGTACTAQPTGGVAAGIYDGTPRRLRRAALGYHVRTGHFTQQLFWVTLTSCNHIRPLKR